MHRHFTREQLVQARPYGARAPVGLAVEEADSIVHPLSRLTRTGVRCTASGKPECNETSNEGEWKIDGYAWLGGLVVGI